MKVRRRARELALQALYEIDTVGHDPLTVISARLNELEEPISPEGEAFARNLIFGVLNNRQDLDTLIGRAAPEFPVDQVAVVDRNILRMALFELATKDDLQNSPARERSPLKVIINEAIELAKRFGSEGSPRFINGALGNAVEHHIRLPGLATKPLSKAQSQNGSTLPLPSE